jgi:serine/threonine protein kinase
MPISLRQFAQCLADSGLMSLADLKAYHERLPAEERPKSCEALAQALVRDHKLTPFQADQLCQGRYKGLVLGNYALLEKLGQGGMGAVFKAQHRRMERLVAIKVLPSEATKSSEGLRRFHREVRAAAKLIHPHIVTAFDADEADDMHFLVMEYVEGRDLGSVLKANAPLGVDVVVGYVLQAARGLAYAHSKGIYHRDIKPANLLLDHTGTVKILDMGLARFEASEHTMTSTEGLTQAGQVMGTVDYMSPEQSADTHSADHRSDIYSLGCTMYRLMINEPAYVASTTIRKIMAHRQNPIPSLQKARPEVSPEVDAVFQKMVAKKPADRQQSMTEVIQDLEACLAEDIHSPPRSAASSEDSALQGFLSQMSNVGRNSRSGTNQAGRSSVGKTSKPAPSAAGPIMPPMATTEQPTPIDSPPAPLTDSWVKKVSRWFSGRRTK